jgi:alkyl hydroperoxide reductase subunit AhpC
VGAEGPDLRDQNNQEVRLADFWPHGEVARAYGVFNEERGFANRGTFVKSTARVSYGSRR